MKITTIGIDLAKRVFQIHGVDEHGKAVLRKSLKRSQLLAYFANLAPCLIGMEACGGAHYWARKLRGYGHTVKLMAPQLVKPYVKTNKNDRADAEAICEAVSRPNMRFVPVKTEEQQAILSVHRARSGFVKARTAQANQIRGLLSEFGLVLNQGIATITRQLPAILEDGENGLPGPCASCSHGWWHTCSVWINRWVSWRKRSTNGTVATKRARDWKPSPGLARSPPAPSSPPSAMPANLVMVASWRHGWDWSHASTRAAVNRPCSVSASAATPICARC